MKRSPPHNYLTDQDRQRYNRQILYPDLGEEGQERLKKAGAVVLGAGGLGSSVAVNLVYAGIGYIRLVDSDPVELSNLNRQFLHWESDIGKEKVLSAGEKLHEMNSRVHVETHVLRFSKKNAEGLLRDMDVAIDCLDNFEARYLLNETCMRMGVPFIHGGVHGLRGTPRTAPAPPESLAGLACRCAASWSRARGVAA